MILETERLILREMTQDDFPALKALLQNPKVMYAYEHSFTHQDVQDWLNRQITRYEQDGFGLWGILLKPNDIWIGQAGLTLQKYKDTKVLEIGYLLQASFWGQGYATEAAEACKRYAFEQLGANTVYAIIKTDNIASRHVAERIGMKMCIRDRKCIA